MTSQAPWIAFISDLPSADRASVDLTERTATMGPADLRSIDAIHLASVPSVKTDLMAFVTYEERVRSAAFASGFEVVWPD